MLNCLLLNFLLCGGTLGHLFEKSVILISELQLGSRSGVIDNSTYGKVVKIFPY